VNNPNSIDKVLKAYNQIQSNLYNRIERITGDSVVTEDILQETLTRGFEQLQSAPIKKPSAWLSRVAHNLTMDHFRKYQPFPLRENEAVTKDLSYDSDTVPKSEAASLIRDLVQRLSPRYRQVLGWHYWDRMTYDEIGNRLGTSAVNAKATAYRGRKRLKDLLDWQGFEGHPSGK